MRETTMEPWRHAFRYGIANVLSERSLESLRKGLVMGDPRLIQGRTIHASDGAVCGACAIAYALWQSGECPARVVDLQDTFQRVAFAAGHLLGDHALVGKFLCWFDGTGRQDAMGHLLGEVNLALARRLEIDQAAAAIVTRTLNEAI